jgi:exodeoxyribonuclease VII small subunit
MTMAKPRKPAGEGAVRDAAATPVGPDGKPYTFEKALARLEEIVDELEDGKLALEASIARFEEGVELTRFLEAELTRAQKRVEELVETAGGATTRPWAEDAGLADDADEDTDDDDAV